ncbi:MAG: hypothetical protein AAFX86_06145 [Pseudomonadota bacterium]
MKKNTQNALTDRVLKVFLIEQFLGGNAASVGGAEVERLTAPFFLTIPDIQIKREPDTARVRPEV